MDGEMTRTWYTADMHFGHANIIDYCSRPWPDVASMDAGLVERWNAVVAPEDTVWVLGDVALSPSKLGPAAELNGRKLLVAGNHDSCWTGHRRWHGQLARYERAGFDVAVPSGIHHGHQVGAWTVRLSHMPYDGDHADEDRYAEHRPADDGTPLLHGHVHDAWTMRTTARGTPQINVGVDVRGWAPVSAETLAAELDDLLAEVTP